MLLHLPIVILISIQPTAVADAVPKFDITRECQAEGGAKAMQDSCMADERQALDQLGKQWGQFGAGEKAQCSRMSGMAGTPSYVELLTCLEMERDVKKTSR